MTVMMSNGKTRRTLAEQIDRLDVVLDALADNLNAAVATAVKDAAGSAVKEAVHEALMRVLTNPELLALLGGAARAHSPEPPLAAAAPMAEESQPGLRDRLGAVAGWAGRQVRSATSAGRRWLGGLGARLAPLWPLRRQLLVALGVGVVAGLTIYFCSPLIASLLSGVAAFGSALAVQTGLWLRRFFAETHLAAATT
jgi:hypothetical protein